MRSSHLTFYVLGWSLSFMALSACHSNPEVEGDGDGIGSGDGDGDGDGDSKGDGDGDGDLSLGGARGDGDGDGDSVPVTPCGDIFCTQETHCEAQGDKGVCVANECEELGCKDNEECVENSLGAYCEDLSCSADIDCSPSRYCDADDGYCKDDVCVPGARSCSSTGEVGQAGGAVYVCRSGGGGYEKEADCGSSAGFSSACEEGGVGFAGCGCEDDWDCPGLQECESGICQGSLEAPTCRLEPADFSEVLPSQELVWGSAAAGNSEARLRKLDGVDVPLVGDETGDPGEPQGASLSAWMDSMQATQVPIVANLDDDNGDGAIDERDAPEILFVTFTSTGVANDGGRANNDGVLRVIHGGGTRADGGSKKGRDYLSVCGPNRWFGGEYLDDSDTELGAEPSCGNVADLDPGATLAVGDLNYDGIPEIVAFGEASNSDGFNTEEGRFVILDNQGRRLFDSGLLTFENADSSAENPGISLANVVLADDPAEEMVEIIIGRDVFMIEVDGSGQWELAHRFTGASASGINAQGPISCVADLLPERPGLEIVAGSAVYGVPLVGDQVDTSSSSLVTLGYDNDRQGFCAIADVWGATWDELPGPVNPLDEEPEIVLIQGGDLYVYGIEATPPASAAEDWTVTLTELMSLNAVDGDFPGTAGGAPNIDDFDGDGFPEIGTAGSTAYVLFDLQVSTGNEGACQEWTDTNSPDPDGSEDRSPPAGACTSDADCNADADPATWVFACNESANVGMGACVCLHNGWSRGTEDDSSQVTGSSVFDFNGDGSAEVIYNDECLFRIYSGLDGAELFAEDSESRTRIEYPVVADVDNDGNAEIVFATTTESGFCSDTAKRPVYNAGIEVWGDLSDRWVSARRVWNQYSYHVTNVNESGQIPRVEPNSWEPLGARLYNTYRSQPRSFGSAPDLVVDQLQVIAPGTCGASSNLVIAAQVSNAGDLRVSNFPVVFYGTWDGEGSKELLDEEGDPLRVLVTQTLEPGGTVVMQVEYDKDWDASGEFPDSVIAVVDPASGDDGVARECHEDNNSLERDVDAAPSLPDLRVVLNQPSDSCPPVITGDVFNDSNVAAADVMVRIYAGDPSTGAKAIGDIPVGSLDADGSVSFDSTDFGTSAEEEAFASATPIASPILVYAVVDPDDAIAECNEANNRHGPVGPTQCQQVVK